MNTRRSNTHPSSAANAERQQYAEQLSMLKEMFPDWHQDDLLALLSELNGDIERAAIRITEGHADQWTAAGKKVPKQDAQKTARPGQRRGQKGASGWGQPTGAAYPPRNRQEKPVQKDADWNTAASPSSWAVDGWNTTNGAGVVATEVTTVTTVKTDSIITETSTDIIQTETVECSVTVVDETGESQTETVQAQVQKIVHEEADQVEAVAAVLLVEQAQDTEEDVCVLLPTRQNRKIEIEPSAVLLPINVPIKTGTNLVFGYKATGSPAESSPKNSPSLLSSSKVYSPEQLFASANRSASQQQQPSSYTTTFVETNNSPPGLVPMQASMGGYDRFASAKQPSASAAAYQTDYDQHLESPRRAQQSSYYAQQQPSQQRGSGYDSYGQTQRYEPQHQAPFNQRYSSYVDPSQHAMDAASYYGAGGRGASTYYHYAPQMMYGADPYSTAAFSHPSTARYPASGSSGYGPVNETGYHHQPTGTGRPSSSSASTSRTNNML